MCAESSTCRDQQALPTDCIVAVCQRAVLCGPETSELTWVVRFRRTRNVSVRYVCRQYQRVISLFSSRPADTLWT